MVYLPKEKRGIKRREKRDCPVCEGTGKVKVKEKGNIVIVVCPRCDGSGYIYV